MDKTYTESCYLLEAGAFKNLSLQQQLHALTLKANTPQKNTLLHYAARRRFLDQVEQTLFSSNLLLATNDQGLTPMHAAAHYGALHQIPPSFLTPCNLSKLDNHDNSSLHWAASGGFASLPPSSCLNAELLTQKNKGGLHALALANMYDGLGRLTKLLPLMLLIELKSSESIKDLSKVKDWIEKEINFANLKRSFRLLAQTSTDLGAL